MLFSESCKSHADDFVTSKTILRGKRGGEIGAADTWKENEKWQSKSDNIENKLIE